MNKNGKEGNSDYTDDPHSDLWWDNDSSYHLLNTYGAVHQECSQVFSPSPYTLVSLMFSSVISTELFTLLLVGKQLGYESLFPVFQRYL